MTYAFAHFQSKSKFYTNSDKKNTVESVFRELVFRGRSGFRGLRFLKDGKTEKKSSVFSRDPR